MVSDTGIPPVVTGLNALATLLGKKRRTVERWVTAERKTGIRHLPQPIPGLRHSWTRESIQRWLRSGIPHIDRRAA